MNDDTTRIPTVRLLDISGIFHPLWRAKEARGEPVGKAAIETVQALRERCAASGADYVVACCDSGRTFRHTIGKEWQALNPSYAGYKGNRAEKDPALIGALDRVVSEIESDGVPIFKVAGFEADDAIASATKFAVENGLDVEIVTDDKDLFQLAVDGADGAPSVRIVRRDGSVVGPAEVLAKFKVAPAKLGELLAIMGDASDHVPGVSGIGLVNAAKIIAEHGGYAEAFEKAAKEDEAIKFGTVGEAYEPTFTAAQRKKLIEGKPAFDFSLRLTQLRTDVPLDFSTVTAPRVPKPKPMTDDWREQKARAANINAAIEKDQAMTIEAEMTTTPQPAATPASAARVVVEAQPEPIPQASPSAVRAVPTAPPQTTALAIATKRSSRDFELELEPRNYDEAMLAAEHAAATSFFKDITSPPQALMVMLLGRKFGLSAMDSLRMIHMIEGKPSMSAQLIVGIVLKSKMAEYFEIETHDATQCTWVTKRVGARREARWSFSIDDAKTAKLGASNKPEHRGGFDPNSNWAKHPKVMCMWRAAVFLARAIYADLVGGLYTPDEIGGSEPEIDGNAPMLGSLDFVA